MKYLTFLKEFGKFLSHKNKRRLTILLVILTAIPSSLLFLFPLEVRYVYIFGTLFLFYIPLTSTVHMITGSTIQMVRMAFYNRKHKSEEIHDPIVTKIAEKMGLVYDKPIHVTDNQAVSGPFVNIYTKIITIPRSWIKKYHHTEILSAIGHELGHIKSQRKYLKEMLLASFAPVGFVFILTLIAEFFGLGYLTLSLQMGTFAVMILLLEFVFHRNEFNADEESAKVLGAEPLIAVFETFQDPTKKDDGNMTHPATSDRIKRLKKYLD